MAENKTKATGASVRAFIDAVEHPRRRADAKVLLRMMKEVTSEKPVMWGPTMIGFGLYHYVYASGRSGDTMCIGFSPRKASLSLYGLTSSPAGKKLLRKLGKHKAGPGCVYVNTLDDIDLEVLREMIVEGYAFSVRTSKPAS